MITCNRNPVYGSSHSHSLDTQILILRDFHYLSLAEEDLSLTMLLTPLEWLTHDSDPPSHLCFVCKSKTEAEGKAKHSCDFGHESMARSQASSHRRMGWGITSCSGFSSLRGSSCWHHNQWQRSIQVWNVSQTRGWSRIWLGLLWITIPCPLFC